MAEHLYTSALEAAKATGRSLCQLSFRALASRSRARAVRHEEDTYAPYRATESGFPQADERRLQFWQDLPKEARSADLVGVIAQFLSHEVIAGGISIREDVLDLLVPSHGGILIFQSGFNTRVPDALEEALWQSLSQKVQQAGAKILFISNGFSFNKDSGKSGTAQPDAAFMKKLMEQQGQLWTHLRDAGLKESTRFAVDQMAKWLSASAPGVDFARLGAIEEINKRAGIPKGSEQEVSKFLFQHFLDTQKAGRGRKSGYRRVP
ncbi:unnamed protein product [Effrenium voratum]|nr:unnamed protein product [Effrenium voratum]